MVLTYSNTVTTARTTAFTAQRYHYATSTVLKSESETLRNQLQNGKSVIEHHNKRPCSCREIGATQPEWVTTKNQH